MTKVSSYFFLLAFFVGIAFSFICGFLVSESAQLIKAKMERNAELQMKKQPPVEVARVVLRPQEYSLTHDATGTVAPWKEAALAFANAGIVATVHVDIGSQVDGPRPGMPGTLLAVLDTGSLQAQVQSAQAELEKAQWDIERSRGLFRQNIASEDTLRQARLVYNVKQALLRVAQKQLQNAHLYAPFTGEIAQRNIEIGESVDPGKLAFRLVQTTKVKIFIDIPEYLIHDIHNGQSCQITIPELPEIFRGNIQQVAPATSLDSHFFRAEIEVANSRGLLKPGLIVRARILLRKLPKVYVFPLEVLVPSGKSHKVVLIKKGKVSDYYYDLSLLPNEISRRLRSLAGKSDDAQAAYEIVDSKWTAISIPATTLLKAYLKEPALAKDRAEILRIFHYGYYAQSQILAKFLIKSQKCIIDDIERIRPGDSIIVRGQHRLTDGREVVIAWRNELTPLVDAAQEKSTNNKPQPNTNNKPQPKRIQRD